MRKWSLRAVAALVLAGVIAAVLISPLILSHAFSHTSDTTLRRYSSLSGPYGAASAVIASLAFAAVAVSIMWQARAARINAQQSLRTLHFNLLKLSLDDDELLESWGDFSGQGERKARRQHIYINMIVQHWWLMYDSGSLSDDQLQLMSGELMRGEPARLYWTVARPAQRTEKRSSQRFKFEKALNASYTAALTTAGATNAPAKPGPTRHGR